MSISLLHNHGAVNTPAIVRSAFSVDVWLWGDRECP